MISKYLNESGMRWLLCCHCHCHCFLCYSTVCARVSCVSYRIGIKIEKHSNDEFMMMMLMSMFEMHVSLLSQSQ